jgi:hypothetical protein
MRKAMLFTTLLILGACAKKEETPAADTTAAVAPAPAPAMADSAAPMVDSAAKDTTKK